MELQFLDELRTIATFSDAFCEHQRIIAMANRLNRWIKNEPKPGETGYQVCDGLPIRRGQDSEMDEMDQRLLEMFNQALKKYTVENPVRVTEDDGGFLIIRYLPGGHYELHHDDAPLSARKISCVLYLNDNFSGGELIFPRQKITITPKPGLLLLFPSSFVYRHEAKSVSDGIKYAVTAFLR